MLRKPLCSLAVEIILPFAAAWVKYGEKHAQKFGRPLNPKEIENVKLVGTLHPERIRILEVNSIFPWERKRFTKGISYRYGIQLRNDCHQELGLIVHEAVHTAQYERLGGIRPFRRDYLLECLIEGYPNGPLETVAIEKTADCS